MKIFLNNELIEVSPEKGVAELFLHIGITETKGIALAVNNTVIPKSEWDEIRFKDRDKVLLIKASQGG